MSDTDPAFDEFYPKVVPPLPDRLEAMLKFAASSHVRLPDGTWSNRDLDQPCSAVDPCDVCRQYLDALRVRP